MFSLNTCSSCTEKKKKTQNIKKVTTGFWDLQCLWNNTSAMLSSMEGKHLFLWGTCKQLILQRRCFLLGLSFSNSLKSSSFQLDTPFHSAGAFSFVERVPWFCRPVAGLPNNLPPADRGKTVVLLGTLNSKGQKSSCKLSFKINRIPLLRRAYKN